MGYDIYSDDGSDLYLHRGMGNMGRLREDLVSAGVAYDSDMPPWPDGDYTEAQLDRVLTWDGCQERPGIAIHKLCSNDGWHIRADEIKSGILHGDVKRLKDTHPDAFDFLLKCASNGCGARTC